MAKMMSTREALEFERAVLNQPPAYEMDVAKLNNLVYDWMLCAREVSGHCRHRAVGQCLAHCRGLMICDIGDLEIIP